MTKTKEVREKNRIPRRKYINLTEIEKDIKRGDLIQCAYEDQSIDFEFLKWTETGDAYAWRNGGRTFYKDAVKLSSREIKKRRKAYLHNKRLTKKRKKP